MTVDLLEVVTVATVCVPIGDEGDLLLGTGDEEARSVLGVHRLLDGELGLDGVRRLIHSLNSHSNVPIHEPVRISDHSCSERLNVHVLYNHFIPQPSSVLNSENKLLIAVPEASCFAASWLGGRSMLKTTAQRPDAQQFA
uniref:Secreted protein n=1 Tax=Steinernema glaseri TaxID=37863 RepID=A0A1I8ATC1_9BILA